MPLNPRMREWRDTRVWIVGASSGIGAALAKLLLDRGARVAISARNAEALARLAEGRRPERCRIQPLDITRPDQVASALGAINDAWSGIDLAILLAGTHRPVRAWELAGSDYGELVRTNLLGTMNATAALMPQLLREGGSIAIVSSVAGYGGLPTSLVYGATKAALINFAETLYLDLAPRGIGVFLVNPGFVRTPLTDRNAFRMPALIEADEAARRIVRGFAAGRFEIHFPGRFTYWMKFMKLLPYRLYFSAVHRFTGL